GGSIGPPLNSSRSTPIIRPTLLICPVANALPGDIGRVVPLIVGPMVPPAVGFPMYPALSISVCTGSARRQATWSTPPHHPTLAANVAPACWASDSLGSCDLQSPGDQIVLTL